MADFVQFTVDDTSPTISYSPFGDTFSTPNLSAGWNPYYTLSGFPHTLGDIGNGTSLHITSRNGSSCLIQWHGTGIQLWGNATSASYSIKLDGAPFQPTAPSGNVLATIEGLTDAPHAVVLTAEIPAVQNPPNSSMIVFEKAVIASSPAPANVSFRSQIINDNDIAFLGPWSFETAPTGASFHTSQTLGDRVVTNFTGTTFLIHGITSPHSGSYTVTVDNTTTSLSGRSSFTSYNSLLFFISGLDSTSVHSVEVANRGGGELSLLVGGFNTTMPYSTTTPPSPLQSSPTSIVTANKSFSQGTIAAFILAGILSFVIFSGLLFFFLVYRPRKRRRAFAGLIRRNLKEHEAGVLNIGPEVTKTPEIDSRLDDSVRNGFSRWRRGAVEGSTDDGDLPIRFRHSESSDEKHPSPISELQLDDVSEDPNSDSSTRRKARAKSRGKARQITGRSWSPGFTFDFRRCSPRQSSVQNPSSPVAESLGYVSTFIAAEPSSPKNVAPPSYAASISIRESNSLTNPNSNSNPSSHPSSNMPSVPRSVSPSPRDHNRSYPTHNQETSGGFLLHNRESDFEPGSSAGHSPHRLKPPEAIPMRSLTKHYRDSAVEDNLDNSQRPVSLQQVIRVLSPRPARHPYALQDQESIQAPLSSQGTNLQDITVLTPPAQMLPSNDDELVEVRDGVFLSVRTPSPFQLNFDSRPIKQPISNGSGSTGLSYVTVSSIGRPTAESSGSSKNPDGTRPVAFSPTGPDFVQGTSNPRLRLTPLSIPPTAHITPPSNPSNGVSEGETSFLDFTSSRDGSLASRSIKTSWSEERQRRSLYPPMIEGKSRWSNTTVPSVRSKSSNNGSGNNGASRNGSSDSSQRIPLESQSSTLPIPARVSVPPSTYHVTGSNRRSRASGLTQAGDDLHVHPLFESLESPTESVPIEVSELHFRQSVSEDNIGFNSRRTTESSLVFVSSHPPLPTRHDDFTPRPFDPSVLVSRVLGLPPPTSETTTARPTDYSSTLSTASSPSPFVGPTGYSSTASTGTRLTPSPFALQHDTSTPGDRSNSDNSEINSLGPSPSS